MRQPLLPLAAALAAALALGCGEQPNPAEPASGPQGSFRTAQNPDGPGAFAEHIPEGGYFATTDDPAPGLTIIVGTTFAQHLEFCETGELPLPLDRLLVTRPDGSVKTRVQGANVPLVVWQTAIPAIDVPAELCDPAFLALPHLEGTAQFLDRDNDLFGSGNRANAFGTRIVGQVRSDAGERFRFLGLIRTVILRSGEPRATRFDLSLQPIGG
jgi:hypothetical protein